jgi:hypothetical protein
LAIGASGFGVMAVLSGGENNGIKRFLIHILKRLTS